MRLHHGEISFIQIFSLHFGFFSARIFNTYKLNNFNPKTNHTSLINTQKHLRIYINFLSNFIDIYVIQEAQICQNYIITLVRPKIVIKSKKSIKVKTFLTC